MPIATLTLQLYRPGNPIDRGEMTFQGDADDFVAKAFSASVSAVFSFASSYETDYENWVKVVNELASARKALRDRKFFLGDIVTLSFAE